MTIARRLAALDKLWTREKCADCRARPSVVCVPDPAAEAVLPHYEEGICPRCGHYRPTVVLLIGVAEDAI